MKKFRGIVLSLSLLMALPAVASQLPAELLQVTVAIAKRTRFKPTDYSSFCSGIVIDPQTVLTASHCLQVCDRFGDDARNEFERCDSLYAPERLRVVMGPGVEGGTFTEDTQGHQLLEVENFVAHSKYKHPDAPYFTYDVAMIRLKEPITQHLTYPQTLPQAQFYNLQFDPVYNEAFAVGYGKREDFKTGKYLSKGIKLAHHFEELKSGERFYPLIVRDEYQLQLHDRKKEVGNCKGDSGGPVFISKDIGRGQKAYYLAAVITSTEYRRTQNDNGTSSKGRCGTPSKSTMVDYHRDWLVEARQQLDVGNFFDAEYY